MLPHIQKQLTESGLNVVRISIRESEDQNGSGHNFLQSVVRQAKQDPAKTPDVVMIDDAIPLYVSGVVRPRKLIKLVGGVLQLKGARVALFGGGFETIDRQAKEMQALLGPILEDNKFISVPNESKPLTAAQVFQILTEDAEALNEQEKRLYFDVVARLIPHNNLKAVRRYALGKDTKSLEHAFDGFLELFIADSVADHLRLVATYPTGGDHDDPVGSKLRDLQSHVAEEIAAALQFAELEGFLTVPLLVHEPL